MKITLKELKRAIDRIDKDKGGEIISITLPLDRSMEIKYNTLDQEATITLFPEETQKFPEIMKKERL